MKAKRKHYKKKIECPYCGSPRMFLSMSEATRALIVGLLLLPIVVFLGMFLGPVFMIIMSLADLTAMVVVPIIFTIKGDKYIIYHCPDCKQNYVETAL